jgi:hypothetical protein
MAGMPCYHCGTRQVDPDRGESPWTRGVLHDHQILVCPVCQTMRDWTAELDRCGRCGSAHLVRRLDEVECRDCGLIRLTDLDHSAGPAAGHAAAFTAAGPAVVSRPAGPAGPATADPELAAEVERALAKVLGRTTGARRTRSHEAGAASGHSAHW